MLFVIRNYGTASGSDFLFVDESASAMCERSESSLFALELNQPDLQDRQHRSHNGREPRKSTLGVRSVKHNLSGLSERHATHGLSREVHNLQCVERRV